MAAELITTVSPVQVAECLQGRGFRAETVQAEGGGTMLRSATAGVPFQVGFGNHAQEAGVYFDFTYSCIVRREPRLDAETALQWNRSRRFGRLSLHEDLIVLEMDVLVAGGVSRDHLLATIEIWDHLVQELVASLRGPIAGAPQATS